MLHTTRTGAATGLQDSTVSSLRSTPHQLDFTMRVIRTHLRMEVAFVSEFVGGRRFFRHVDAAGDDLPIRVGVSDPLEDSYCQRIVDGRLPELIHDAATLPAAAAMPVTRAFSIGAHLSVPIRLSNGSVYGTFCCFSRTPDHSLSSRDLQMMQAFAELTAHAIEADLACQDSQKAKRERVRRVFENDQLAIVYQPIIRLRSGRIVGMEALSRFSAEPQRGPDVWFAEAAEVGLGTELELHALRKAIAVLTALPEDVYVTLNISPDAVMSGQLPKLLRGTGLERLVLEITEHAAITDYEGLMQVLRPLRRKGLRLAVDDAGAGYSSLRHVLNLKPDLIKLDVGLIRNINRDASRRALATALIAFSRATGSCVIAEGVETAQELNVLRKLGVEKAQGYLLARPLPLEQAVALRSSLQLKYEASPNSCSASG